ncbi:hypothetical protein BLOT_000013 [Blomia tropicalis]|nr:hypothetical protein BLOT_000013 [Blomia tropicalis]
MANGCENQKQKDKKKTRNTIGYVWIVMFKWAIFITTEKLIERTESDSINEYINIRSESRNSIGGIFSLHPKWVARNKIPNCQRRLEY